ncbi:hypothetical protein TgHK011_007328 [Trichoderma gracile]|nr:hypothetical protein TgHK011_007328 [Trichoderma gracile]
MATGRQTRADRLNERLRGAQRANVDDESFNLGIDSLDIGSLVIASSIASNSSPAVRTKYSPTTSAKRRKIDKDVPPSPEAKSSSTPRRRRGRPPRAEPPVESPVLPEAEMQDVLAPEQGDEEDDELTPRPGRTFQVPHSSSSVRTAARQMMDIDAEDELETLPPHPSAISAALLRSPTSARSPEKIIEEVTESPADAPGSGKRRRVPMSETLSSTARLMGVISSDDGMPMPSSPLASKVRRSDATTIRSARSAGTIYGQEISNLADELSSDNFPQAVDGRTEATDLAMEDDTFAQDEDGVAEEYRLEEQEHADEIDEGKVARILDETARRPRGPSPELGSQDIEEAGEMEEEQSQPEAEPTSEAESEPQSEPEAEPEPEPELEPQAEADSEPEIEVATEAEEEEEEVTVLPTPPKRKRGRPSKSPTTQKQPPAKSKTVKSRKRVAPRPQEYNDENDENEEPQAKKAKPKTKKRHSDQSEGDGGTIEITVQRFVNLKKRGKEDDDEDPLQSEMAFVNHGGESVIDVFAQVCDEVISSTLEKFQEVASGAEDAAKKKEYRIKMRAIEAYREELKSRFLQHAIHLNHWHSLRKRVRHVQKERMALREEIMRIKAEREQVALRMDAIRIQHEADARESKYCLDASSLMHDVDLAVEQGREAPELSRAAQKEAELANLELLVSRVSQQASSSSFTGGILKQVKDFNSFLERAAMALESR